MGETSEPIPDFFDPQSRSGWVYRAWDAEGRCLYIGQTARNHPWVRLNEHRRKRWWAQVHRVDYIEVYDVGDLLKVEKQQIDEHRPVHNLGAGGHTKNIALKLRSVT